MFKAPDCAMLDYFSSTVAADSRRKEFNIKNHTLISNNLHPDFLFIGDSITHYWELNAYFNQPNQLIVNRGIGGDTTTFLLKRFQWDVLSLSPKYCILGIGINDSIDLESDYWNLTKGLDYKFVLSRAKDNLENIVGLAKDNGLNLILTSLPAFTMPISSCEELRKQFAFELNTFIQEICKDNKLIYVDYYAHMVGDDQKTVIPELTYDGLHPNSFGYDIMARTLKDTLNKNHITI